MAAGHAFLTQVSSHAWKCSECPQVFTAEDTVAVNRMLDRFVHHVRKAHAEYPEGATPWKPRRRRREMPEDPDLPVREV